MMRCEGKWGSVLRLSSYQDPGREMLKVECISEREGMQFDLFRHEERRWHRDDNRLSTDRQSKQHSIYASE